MPYYKTLAKTNL